MANDLALRDADQPVTLSDPSVLVQAMKLADAMATAKTLPDHLRGSPGDCLRVIEIAFRTRQSPYAIADKTYFVSGKLAFEGQLCAALINAHPSIEQRLNYEYEGQGQSLACTVSAKLKGERQPRTVKVTVQQGLRDSKGAKARWEGQPEQMLAYYGARVWGRRHAPEILLGMYTPDELEAGPQMRDITPHDSQTGEIRDPLERYEARQEPEPEDTSQEQPDLVTLWVKEGREEQITLDEAAAKVEQMIKAAKSLERATSVWDHNFRPVLLLLPAHRRDTIEGIYNDARDALESQGALV